MAEALTKDQVQETAVRFRIEPAEWVSILSAYTTRERLRIALPLLATRHGKLRFTHAELGGLVCASREKVTDAIQDLRNEGFVARNPTKRSRRLIQLAEEVSREGVG